ncbi:hypothetical protein ACQP0C_26860 [Nocardia sp. CA-129566]|uniref:hypothetical protein n=1 Tax=Nocardia sp. CA-129566 TaxID=3239976 RepID=UPI003D963950
MRRRTFVIMNSPVIRNGPSTPADVRRPDQRELVRGSGPTMAVHQAGSPVGSPAHRDRGDTLSITLRACTRSAQLS